MNGTREEPSTRSALDLSGQKFGLLTVVAQEGATRRGRMWRCVCVCGASVVKGSEYLRRPLGVPHSCGCATKPDRMALFMDKVRRTDGCWEWTGARNTQGYGSFFDAGSAHGAHRWLYERVVGKVPEGLHLDHLCRVRHCVNPSHLEPVTVRENAIRGARYLPDSCRNGHPRMPENTHVRSDGSRYCRECKRVRDRARGG